MGFSNAVALLSLALSLFALTAQRRGAGQAHFTAEWEDDTSVVFINQGPAPARDVHVSVSSSPDGGGEPTAGDASAPDPQPMVPIVGAYQTVRVTTSSGQTSGAPSELAPRLGDKPDARGRRRAYSQSPQQAEAGRLREPRQTTARKGILCFPTLTTISDREPGFTRSLCGPGRGAVRGRLR